MRALSPKISSSPFLHKTIDAPSHSEMMAHETRRPSIYNENENDDIDDHDSFQHDGSSPFRYDARDDTVDFQQLREMQRASGGAEDMPSSPFQPDGREETVDFEKLRELQRESPALDAQPMIEAEPTSPFRPGARNDTVDFQKLHESQRASFGVKEQSSPPVAPGSPSRRDSKGNTLDLQKQRDPRVSLGVDEPRSPAATPRKRSFDQTPLDQGDYEQNERCKKGMVSRMESADIHVDEEESSVIHNSIVSSTSALQERSTIANSAMEDKRNEGMSTVLHDDPDKENYVGPDDDTHDSMDDTCLSNFSAVPNLDMTQFAQLRRESPLKAFRNSIARSTAFADDIDPATPSTARKLHRASVLGDGNSPAGSPTPRGARTRVANETPDLLDFTDQMNFLARSSMQQNGRYSPTRRSPLRAVRQSIRSPSKLSLLDFDIPPAPTPRSIPTITPRELESLKSGFMSEISSLKATLSGKDAEVTSLKKAVADAERRVGEALEEVRNEAARKEALEIEQAEWERRGKDMESVLRSVRAELVEGERERDRLSRKAEEAEKSKEQLEGKVVELESQLSAARTSASSESGGVVQTSSKSAEDTAREVQDAVEKVARELHTLYKGKHETKVAALKKSYEARWEKRVREAENKFAAACEETERLKVERDSATSDSMAAANSSLIARENDEHETEKRVLEAQIKGLQQEMASLKEDSERLWSELKSERAEKGELVAAVDEWLAMQQSQPPPAQHRDRQPSVPSSSAHEDDTPSNQTSAAPAEPVADNFRRSIGRSGASGIRAPGAGDKKIPRYGGHSRGNSGGKSGVAVFTPGTRGGIMSSIERMGRGGM